MMHEPDADALLAAVGQFLADTAAPGLSGRAAFHARVAANAVALARREQAHGPAAEAASAAALALALGRSGSAADLVADAARAIRTGALDWTDPALIHALRTLACTRLAIEQPGYSGLAAARDKQWWTGW